VADSTTTDGTVILPIRPIVVGGDDIVILCHGQYAFDFVEEACRAFTAESAAQADKSGDLWPATGGTLTTSAGVLFCPISLPLHMAIPYTESLLASAKGEGRKHSREGAPSPACIDFEVVTETMLDTVADRRNRLLRFIDGDTDTQIELTEKPYQLDEFATLRSEAKTLQTIPRSIRHQMLPSLRAGQSDRSVFRAQIRKRHPELFKRLDESTWTVRENGTRKVLSTPVLDQLSILEEEHRLSQAEEAW